MVRKLFVCIYLFSVAAQITVQHQQGANIAIAIRSPAKSQPHHSHDSGHQSALFSNSAPLFPMPIPTASPPTAIPSQTIGSSLSRGPTNLSPLSSPPAPIPSQTISPSSSWGLMMTPGEVQELLAPEPQTGEYYVVTKGRRPGVYLSW
jgi:hypothetical protein